MIVDLTRFVTAERPIWEELSRRLDEIGGPGSPAPTLEAARRLHYLYERTSSDLQEIASHAGEPELQRYLESLVARAYGEIHQSRGQRRRWQVRSWLLQDVPRTFRLHLAAFAVVCVTMLLGIALGGIALTQMEDAKDRLIPPMFANHMVDPDERVAADESDTSSAGSVDLQTAFAGELFVNNSRVSLQAFAFGFTFGIGTLVTMFYNGVLLGLIGTDYVLAGQSVFLLAWLLPHGSVEIPAILIAGQGGLVLASALIGWADHRTLATRMRAVSGHLVNLLALVILLLAWAALVEAFFSQYHEPILPYSVKIATGVTQLVILAAYLLMGGRRRDMPGDDR